MACSAGGGRCDEVFLLLLTACVVLAQSGYWSSQYGQPMLYSATPFVVNVNGADTWGLNSPVTYVLAASACSKYYLILTKQSSFFTATIINPNVCNYPSCNAPKYDQKGCQTGSYNGWASYANVYPFSLEWYDVSTTDVFVLPTRQNVPTNMNPESSTFVISQALASNLATLAMRLQFTILPRQTNLMKIGIWGWYTNFPNVQKAPPAWLVKDYSFLFTSMASGGRIGSQYTMTAQYDSNTDRYTVQNWFRRKQPTPAFYFKLQWGGGCWYANWWANSINNCGWYNLRYFYSTGKNDWNNEVVVCTGSDCGNWYTGVTSTTTMSPLAWEYYEDFRMWRNNLTISFNDVASRVLQASNSYSMVVPMDGNFSFGLRFSWTNLTDVADCCSPTAIKTAQRNFIGVFMMPPFAIQDAWITVFDENGNRIFTEVEKRVPYRGSTGIGQPGWHLALSNRTWGSKFMSVTLRWNRRNLIGTREEEVRVSQLISFVTDNGGWVGGLTTPIPQTLISGSGVMGVVASQAISKGQLMANISFQSCLTGNMTQLLWLHKLQHKLNASTIFNTYWVNSTEPYHQEQIVMTIILTTGLPSELDESTTFWTVADAMYPVAPAMLPHFWDPNLVSRLLGFSEIPTFIAYHLGNWSFEYNRIAAAWPWFGLEVSVSQYQSMRAHVRRSILPSPSGEAFLPPFVHLMRHSSTTAPNTNMQIEWSTRMVTLTAAADVAFQTELIPNYNPSQYHKHEYFLLYGAVSPLAVDSATVPNFDGYLDSTATSRQTMVRRWATTMGTTYRAALETAISVMSQKLANLPVLVNGLGATSDQVQTANVLLAAERSVLAAQIADANVELTLLMHPATP